MKKADSDRFDAAFLELPSDSTDRGFIEGRHDIALGIKPLGYSEAPITRYEWLRFLEVNVVKR